MSIKGTTRDRDARRDAWLESIMIACVAYYVLAVVALHVLRPEYDPVSRVTSNYAVGPYGYLMTATFFALAGALLALSLGLSRTLIRQARSRVGLGLLVAAALGVIVAGILPTDVTPDDSPVSTTGLVHILAGVSAFLCITAAALVIARKLDRDPQWQASKRPALLLAFAIVVGLVISIVAQPLGGRGIGQRVFLGTVLLWLLFMAARLGRVAKPAPS